MEHKLIQGGELWLPFARSRIKALQSLGLDYASQKFTMPDGALCVVRIEPGNEYIQLSGGSSLYEFFTTGPILNIDYSSGFGVYKGYGVSVSVDTKTKTLIGKAVGSTLEESVANPPDWKFSPYANDMRKFMPHKNAFQIQGAIEHQYFPDLKPPKFLLSCWTGASQINWFCPKGVNNPRGYLFDVGYDVAPSIYNGIGYPSGHRGLAPDSDWYRRAAVRSVKSPEFGGRTLILMTDATGNLLVYPTTEQDATLADSSPYWDQMIKTNVQSSVAKVYQIPFPSWARTHTSPARDNFPVLPDTGTYRWEFNSSCTRMVCILANDLPPTFYGKTKDDLSLSDKQVVARESLTGLLEISIDITLTGPNAADFTVALTVSDEISPTSETYAITADYYWGDLPEETSPGPIAKDSLIYMTMDIYHKHNEGPPPAGQSKAGFTSMRAQVKVVNRVNASILREFVAHTADAPYGMDGAPYSGSFLEIYRGYAEAAAYFLSYSCYDQEAPGTDPRLPGLWVTFRADSLAFINAVSIVTCDIIAQYDKIIQKYLDDELKYANSPFGQTTMMFFRGTSIEEYIKQHTRQRSILSNMLAYAEDMITIKTWLLAYDLRVLAFATQTAAFRNIGDQTTRQDRVQVIVRNEVVETKDAPDPIFAALITASENPWTQGTGWTRLAVESVANPANDIQAFRSVSDVANYLDHGADIYNPANTHIGVSPYTRSDYDVDYPVGAVSYNFYAQSFLSMEVDDAFCIHPAGHWSITVKPIVYYAGVSQHHYLSNYLSNYTSSWGTAWGDPQPFNGLNIQAVDTASFVQQTVDIVNVRLTSKDINGVDVVEDIKTTHLTLFNQAYKKIVKPEDFNFVFSSSINSANSNTSRVALVTVSLPNIPVSKEAYYVTGINMVSNNALLVNRCPSYIGIRDLSQSVQYENITYGPSLTEYKIGTRITDVQPNMRGSALFTGKLVQRWKTP